MVTRASALRIDYRAIARLSRSFCGSRVICVRRDTGYYIGRFLGPKLHQTKFAVKRARMLSRAENSVRKYGVLAIFIGRFLTPIRSVVPLLTGVSGMTRVKFTTYDFIACAFWSACLGLLVIGLDKLWS